MIELLSTYWAEALALLVSWPLLLALLAFRRWVSPAGLLVLGVPSMLLATWVPGLAVKMAADLPLAFALGGWLSPLGIQWLLDEAAWVLLVTVNVIASLAAIAAWLFGRALGGSDYFWPLWWLLWGGMNALVVSADLFNLYVTLELVTLAAVGLVAQSRNDPEGKAAMNYLLASLLASLLYLLGVALIYGQTGVLDLQRLTGQLQADAVMALAALLMTLGLLLKAAVVPLHFWLPEAHSRAQAPVSVLLSSVVIALAVYLLWRLWLGPFQPLLASAQPFFSVLATSCLIWGGVQAWLQPRLKLVLAYSTLSQIGFALLLLQLVALEDISAWSSLAEQGSLIFILAHGLAKAALFMVAGALMLALSTDRLKQLQGSAKLMPLAWVAFALASLSLLGAPPTAGFVGKWFLLQVAWQQSDWITVGLLLAGTLITAIYLFRVMQFAWKPAAEEAASLAADIRWRGRALAGLALLTALASWALGLGLLHAQPWPIFAVFGLDALAATFLGPAVLIWSLAWLYAKLWQSSGQLLWLLAWGGLLNILLLLAQDLLSFYIFFALLSFLGWWLVISSGKPEALAAGRVYLAMSLLGELAFFTALGVLGGQALDFASLAANDLPAAALWALGLAFAIKAGVLGVHFWLPLAHPVAPAAASAVLSGLMIKAGLIGAFRVFPEQSGLEPWGWVLLVLGWVAAFYTVILGLLQKQPKSLLAWSSVSQMGLMTALLGSSLILQGEGQQLALVSLLLLALTHALAKAGLFLGVGLVATLPLKFKPAILVGQACLALTLVGVPIFAGVYGKYGLQLSLALVAIPAGLLFASSLATSLLLGRFLELLAHQKPPKSDSPKLKGFWLLPWWLLIVAAVLAAGLFPQEQVQVSWWSFETWWQGWLPVGLALAMLLLKKRFELPSGLPRLAWRFPEFIPRFTVTQWLLTREERFHPWSSVGWLLALVAAFLGALLAYSLVY